MTLYHIRHTLIINKTKLLFRSTSLSFVDNTFLTCLFSMLFGCPVYLHRYRFILHCYQTLRKFDSLRN